VSVNRDIKILLPV